jgi:argininosuccinate lyase
MSAQKSSPEKIDLVLGLGGRLGEKPSVELIGTAFTEELNAQRVLFSGMDLADIAYVIQLTETGVVPEKDGAELLAALLELRAVGNEFVSDPALGDLYTNREDWLSDKTAAAGWLGVGRARRESATTAFQIVIRRELLNLSASLCALGGALADKAEAHRDTVMPDYTYLQAAQPTTFGHYLLSFAFPILRDLERIQAMYSRVNKCPSGCGSANGSVVVKDRDRLAILMGFDGIVDHARDAMWQTDLPIEALSVVVACLVNLDRLAEDLMVFSSVEFGVITLADAHARSSKIMPQKKNPFALSYIRGLANRAIGVQASLAAAGRTPSGQMDNRMFAYGDTPNMISLNEGAARLMAAVVKGLSIDSSRAEALCEENFSIASDLAEMVVREAELDYRTAHRLVGWLSRDVFQKQRRVSDVTSKDLDRAAEETIGKSLGIDPKILQTALDPRQAIANRDGPGGAAPEPLAAMINSIREGVGEFEAWYQMSRKRDAKSEIGLLEIAESIARKA